MNPNQKEHFLHWLMYLLFFFCTGPVGIILWTAYCLVKYDKSEREYEIRKMPIQCRPEIKAMNTEEYLKENLTEIELFKIKRDPGLIYCGRNEKGDAEFYKVDARR